MASLLLRQIWTLAWKDLLVLFSHNRASFWTVIRSFTAPLFLAVYLSVILRSYFPSLEYGIGSARSIRSLSDGFAKATSGRNTLALVNYGPDGGDIEQVINLIAEAAETPGKTVTRLKTEDELLTVCRSTLYGTTKVNEIRRATSFSLPFSNRDQLVLWSC